MAVASFGEQVLIEFLGGVAAAAVILLLLQLALDLGKQRRARKELVRSTLKNLHAELVWNARLARTFVKELGADACPAPGFDTTGDPYVSNPDVVRALKPATTEQLLMTYNRLRAANRGYDEYWEVFLGSTAALHGVTSEAIPDKRRREKADDRFEKHRTRLRTSLLDRVVEMQPHLEFAMGAIEHELDGDVRPTQETLTPHEAAEIERVRLTVGERAAGRRRAEILDPAPRRVARRFARRTVKWTKARITKAWSRVTGKS